MKRKCLGCGKIFEDKISVCAECLNVLEGTRKDILLKYYFRKDTWLNFRKSMPILLLFLFGVYSFLIIKILGLFFKIFSFKQILVFFYPSIAVLVMSFFWRVYFGRSNAKHMVKYWSNKDLYTLSLWGRIKKIIWLREFISIFFLPGVIITVIGFLLFYFDSSIFAVSFYNISKHTGDILIIRAQAVRFFISAGFVLGVFVGSFFYSDWIAKLSK